MHHPTPPHNPHDTHHCQQGRVLAHPGDAPPGRAVLVVMEGARGLALVRAGADRAAALDEVGQVLLCCVGGRLGRASVMGDLSCLVVMPHHHQRDEGREAS